jgi:hypothetical protein
VRRSGPTFEQIYEASFEQISEEARCAYFGVGNNPRCPWALMDIIRLSARWDQRLPTWARQVLEDGYELGISKIRSWDDIFGKPYQQFKTPKRARNHGRQLLVWRIMQDRPVHQASFDALADDLEFGKRNQDGTGFAGGSTLRDLCYDEKDRRNPPEEPSSNRKRPPKAR